MDLRQTPEYAQYMQQIGWSVERLNHESGIRNYVYVKQIPLLGKIAKLQRPKSLPKEEDVDSFAKEHKIAVFYLEPTEKDLGFAKSGNSFLPSKTIHINLVRLEKEILAAMDKKTRYAIRLAEKNGVMVKESRDIDSFAKHWQSSARQRWMFFSQKKEIKALFSAFGPKAHILFAYQDQDLRFKNYDLRGIISGVLLVRTNNTAHYMYSWSTKQGNRLCAPSLLVWEALKLAKSKGCKVFDLEGIYDERYSQTKSWEGFTNFKKGFGGEEVVYPPTLVKYYNPVAKILNL